MATAVHSYQLIAAKQKVVLNLNKDYFSEGVLAVNVASKFEFLKSLCSTLQSHKVQEARMADFGPFHGLLSHRRQRNQC